MNDMSIEMQRLFLKEIQEKLSNIDKILNEDCCKVNNYTAHQLVQIHLILSTQDLLNEYAEEEK
jgi:hypothetical protein